MNSPDSTNHKAAGIARAIVDASSDVIFAKDAEGRLQFVNPAAVALIGKPIGQILGHTDHEFLDDPAAADVVRANDLEVLSRGERVEAEEAIAMPDGSPRIWLSQKIPHRDAEGRIVGLLGISRDITERKQLEHAREEAQRELHRSREQLRFALDSVGAGIFDWDLRADTLGWDDRARELYGLDADAPAVMATLLERMHLDDRTGFQQQLDDALASENEAQWRRRYRVRRPEGGYRWIESTGRVHHDSLPDGSRRAVRFSGLIFDVSEQVAAAERLQQSEHARRDAEDRLMLAMSSSSLGWWDMDISTQQLYWSRNGRRLFDLESESKVDLSDPLSRIHPDDRDRIVAAITQAQDPAGDGSYREQYRVIWRDGSEHWVDAVGQMQFTQVDGQRKADRFVGVLWDITEQRRQLAGLREASRLKDVFLATLAHELRNPLAPVRTAAHLLSLPELDLPRARWAAEVIQRQVTHMGRLLDDLMDVARITRGRLELQREWVSIETVVETAVEANRQTLANRSHHLEVVLPPQPPMVWIDPVRLAQVLGNLLGNAAKYTDPGGRIVLTVSIAGDTLELSVRDSGIGLPADDAADIFDMFSQRSEALDRSEGGLGIGLNLVKGLVELHGGHVRAQSPGPAQGSTFTITLPLPDAVHPPGEASGMPGIASRPHLSIVVADDNLDAALSLGLLLEFQGHDVRVAHDGHQALAAFRQEAPDVMLLDIGMPGLTGLQVAEAIRASDTAPQPRLAAISGWGQPEDRQRAIEAGFDLHFTKPVAPDDVLAWLAQEQSMPAA